MKQLGTFHSPISYLLAISLQQLKEPFPMYPIFVPDLLEINELIIWFHCFCMLLIVLIFSWFSLACLQGLVSPSLLDLKGEGGGTGRSA